MKPFYVISLVLLTVLIGCQYLSQHPDQVQKLEKSAEDAVEVMIDAHGVTGS